MQFGNKISRPQLADTTSGREGAALVGTDTKTNLNNATEVETALTFLDTFVADTLANPTDPFGLLDFQNHTRDPFEIRSNYGISIQRNGDIYWLETDVQTGDIPTLTAGDGISISSTGSDYTITSDVTVTGGQGITVVQSGQDFTIHQRESRVSLTDASSVTLDCANDNNFRLDMSSSPSSRTLALSNVSVGQKFSILLKQLGGGSTVTWWSGIIWPAGTPPTLTSTATKGDLLAFECLGSGVYLGFIVAQNFDLTGV